MKTRLAIGVGLVLWSAAGSLWAADYRPLDVKPGQWETTVNGMTSGMPPIPDEVLQRMTPEQRAKMEAAWKARSGASTTTVNKNCIKKEDLDKPFGPDSAKTCTLTFVSSSATKQEIRVTCNRESMTGNGTLKVEALDSEHIKGEMQMTANAGQHTMNMNSSFSSKWLGPTCTEK